MEIDISYPGGKRVAATFNGFTVETDQSEEQGGGGSAPDPFQLFFASIATCTGWYAMNFCLKRNIPIDGLAIKMRTEKEEDKKMTGKIIIDITPPAGFPAKYHAPLIRAVGSCTVKKHIEDPPEFEVHISG